MNEPKGPMAEADVARVKTESEANVSPRARFDVQTHTMLDVSAGIQTVTMPWSRIAESMSPATQATVLHRLRQEGETTWDAFYFKVPRS